MNPTFRKLYMIFLLQLKNVVYMSSSDLLIWQNFEFWSTNVWVFLTEKTKNIDKCLYILQNSKFYQISKSPDDIHKTKVLNEIVDDKMKKWNYGFRWSHLYVKKKGKGNRAAFLLTSQVKCEALCDWEMHFSVSNRWKGAVDCWDCCQERVCKIKGEGLLPAMFWALAQYLY